MAAGGIGADPVSIRIEGLKELRATLRSIDRRLPAQLTRELRSIAEPVRVRAAALAPRSRVTRRGRHAVKGRFGRGGTIIAYTPEANRHVGDTLKVGVRGNRLSIYSTRSGAGVIHWGGRHPLFGDRDRWFTQPPHPFAATAIAELAPKVERDIGNMLERAWNGSTGLL